MATVTARIEIEFTMKCSKRAAKGFAADGDDTDLQPLLELAETAVENALIHTKGYDSHNIELSEITDAEED